MKVGDRVVITDYSDADGCKGVIWNIQANGIILVELDADPSLDIEPGTLWPVDDESELEQEAND